MDDYLGRMATSIEVLTEQALHLPEDQRLTLACQILSSVEPASTPEVEAAWDEEIRKRIAKFDAGESAAVPASEVFDEIERRLGK
jgi:putative addiction module component (TIGR02574 family)